jgi:purine-binding chemotaxis protein CheW
MNSQNAGNQKGRQNSASQPTRSCKFLTFFLAGEEYGIEILKVHEIIGMLPITRVPKTPDFVRGVINLRGKVIPIIDARVKFGMPAAEATKETCIIVVHIRSLDVGVVVDRVSEVVDIPETEIVPPPSFGSGFNTELIMGIGKTQGRIKVLLNIERVLLVDKLSQLKEVHGVAEPLAS